MDCNSCGIDITQNLIPEIHDIICPGRLLRISKLYIEQLDVEDELKETLWTSQIQALKKIFKPKYVSKFPANHNVNTRGRNRQAHDLDKEAQFDQIDSEQRQFDSNMVDIIIEISQNHVVEQPQKNRIEKRRRKRSGKPSGKAIKPHDEIIILDHDDIDAKTNLQS